MSRNQAIRDQAFQSSAYRVDYSDIPSARPPLPRRPRAQFQNAAFASPATDAKGKASPYRTQPQPNYRQLVSDTQHPPSTQKAPNRQQQPAPRQSMQVPQAYQPTRRTNEKAYRSPADYELSVQTCKPEMRCIDQEGRTYGSHGFTQTGYENFVQEIRGGKARCVRCEQWFFRRYKTSATQGMGGTGPGTGCDGCDCNC